MTSRDYIMEKVNSLPDDSLQEVLDFIEFLKVKKSKGFESSKYKLK